MKGQPRSFYLFAALVLMLIFFPLAVINVYTQLAFRFLMTVIVLGGVYAISHNRRHFNIGLAFAAPSLILNVLVLFVRSSQIVAASMMCGVIFFIYLMQALMRHVLRDHRVTVDTIYCAVAIYMLAAVTFTVIFILIEYLAPGSFKGEFHPNGYFNFTFEDGLYFSVCTLTTVGYGDVLPVGAEARSVAMLESMLGVLYPSILIARLVGLHASYNPNDLNAPPARSDSTAYLEVEMTSQENGG